MGLEDDYRRSTRRLVPLFLVGLAVVLVLVFVRWLMGGGV